MTEKFITQAQIEKLGHKIQEIRERALFNIFAKLENGVSFDNDLARSKELLNKLFRWFLFEPCSQEDNIFSLLKNILKSESGRTIINHYGKEALQKEVDQLQTYIEPKYFSHLNELRKIINEVQKPVVPPIESEVPLSYRSGSTSYMSSRNVGTTATPIVGSVNKQSSVEQQTGVEKLKEDGTETPVSTIPTYTIERDTFTPADCPSGYVFKWQPLVEADRHVLESVNKSLTSPSQPADILHSCEFVTNVLIHDFPAEVFLQRPSIVQAFYSLLHCGSKRVSYAVLNCLNELTKSLRVRLYHCSDVSMQNFKLEHLFDTCSIPNTPTSSVNTDLSENDNKLEKLDEIVALQRRQFSTPKFCFTTVREIFNFLCVKHISLEDRKTSFSQNAVNLSLNLLEELLELICLTVSVHVWGNKHTEATYGILKMLSGTFSSYGDALEYFRIESATCEADLKYRSIYLYLVHHTAHLLEELVPKEKSALILPQIFKVALSNCLLDITFARLYPGVHSVVLSYVECFAGDSEVPYLKRYKDINGICKGMTSTVKFMRGYKELSTSECLKLAQEALPSLEFHKELDFLKIFVDCCSNKLGMFAEDLKKTTIAEETILCLMSHNLQEIREEVYRLCHKKVKENIGPNLNLSKNGDSGSQIVFLLTSKILTEVAAFGMADQNKEIQRYAEDILSYILKCKILVSDTVWNKVIQTLITSLPMIMCHSTRNSVLGKICLNVTDPDTAKTIFIPDLTILKANLQLMFSNDAYLRDEGFSRICWLLSTQQNARVLLPKFTSLYDPSLANICRLKRLIDVNKLRRTDHFYQPSSLQQVMDVLNTSNVEPVIRRSALNQVSVMLEDPLLHLIFLDSNGIRIVIDIMKTALVENDYRDYTDSIIPVISILKNLCLYHGTVREELGCNIEVFYYILRGLFLFFTEERLKQDAVSLLFVLIFKDFIRGSPSQADFSLPVILSEKILLPFQCAVHWKENPYMKESLRDLVMNDRWCLSCVRIQWNCEVFGGFQELIKWESVSYDGRTLYNVEDILKLNDYELKTIKLSSIDYCVKYYLKTVQNGTSHSIVLESVESLVLYMSLYKLTRLFDSAVDNSSFLSHPWEISFARFIRALPSCTDDATLLSSITKFFSILVPLYNGVVQDCWILASLKDPTKCLIDLITIDNTTEEEVKLIGHEILKLIIICVRMEQHYLDYYTPNCGSVAESKSWIHVFKAIVRNLKFSDAQHFYNLAYLDSLLSCLVYLTATLGWSENKPNTPVKQPIPDLIAILCDLVNAFHTGKGASAGVSVMGLSITRNALLVLNHLISELLNSQVRSWEHCFLQDVDGGAVLHNLVALWTSRDTVLRAAAMQLFAGLATSPKAVTEIVDVVKVEAVLTILMDHNEASIVRENAAQFLANLISHAPPLVGEKTSSVSLTTLKKSYTMDFFNTLDEMNLYGNLEVVLSNLFSLNLTENQGKRKKEEGYARLNGFSSSDGSSDLSTANTENDLVTTPALVKAFGYFLLNLLNLNLEDISNKLQENGLVKLLFRSLCNPTMAVSDTRTLSLYCDILEMDTVMCYVLSRLAACNSAALGTILHTKDCFSRLISLLDPRIYATDYPQLIYLRNQLWTSIFNLMSTLVEYSGGTDGNLTDRSIEAASIFSCTILDLGNEPFFEAVCESIACLGFNGLQNAALTALTYLLRLEIYRIFENHEKPKVSVFESASLQSLLDSVRTNKTVIISDRKENLEPLKFPKPSKKLAENYKMDVLEELYFGKVFRKREWELPQIDIDIVDKRIEPGEICGAEVCKILLGLYDVCDLKREQDFEFRKKKSLVIAALSGLLGISSEAKKQALEQGLMLMVVKQLRDYHMRLSLESVECLRRVADKRRVCPILKEVHELIGLLTNFMLNDEKVKMEAASLNVADVMHKLWIWFLAQNIYLVDMLKMLCVYTTSCNLACQTLPLTSSLAGSGPRKCSSNISLLHAIIHLINKRMDLISKTHDLSVLEASFNILINCCESLECRVLILKSNIFQSISKLHPATTKRQKPWDDVELLWLEFLRTYTNYPEGQASVAKALEVLELVMALTTGSRPQNRILAMAVLRNLAFHQPNRPRLLSSGDFLNILDSKLTNASWEEKNMVVVIIWALIANNQKAKITLKSTGLDKKLQNMIKQYQLFNREQFMTQEDIERMYYVLSIIKEKDHDKVR